MKEDSFSDVSNDELEFITIGETNLEGMQVDSGSVSGLHVPSSDAHMIVPSNSDLGVVASGSALEDDRLSMDGRAMDLDDPEWTPTGLKQETKGPGQDGNLMSQTEEVDCKWTPGWKFSGLFLNSGFLGWLSIESQPQNAELGRL